MAQSPPPPFDPYRAPVIEGFTPTSYRGETERFQSKFMRKFRQNPFVPLGCLGTAGILTYGLICFINNKPKQSQMMMRARVIAQGLTIASLLVGMAVTNLKSSK
ncbi:HIG1 domain family member 2A, mitochondrial [Protobothrops mucrosquamatus]|uniref:HIG1 domain family member 2A, mitochondrial n=1 Tax=Protobothrops mucrosquamatus TaxID=103944 RepID=UPI0007756CA7|nr:HIG1 domain family member 2A, mitochondrial [Protobothrops mucrosquamatus]XP_015677016.1 HIG1 domain family member 2A, mitochondrial [Protobothrops mucrosquamatus]